MAVRAVETKDINAQTSSEAQALADILAWSKDCPTWQRNALRRLGMQEDLEENDLEELTGLCKNKGKGGVALAAESIPDLKAATAAANLRAIHGVENVNALKEGDHLTFDKTRLTVVYGDTAREGPAMPAFLSLPRTDAEGRGGFFQTSTLRKPGRRRLS